MTGTMAMSRQEGTGAGLLVHGHRGMAEGVGPRERAWGSRKEDGKHWPWCAEAGPGSVGH